MNQSDELLKQTNRRRRSWRPAHEQRPSTIQTRLRARHGPPGESRAFLLRGPLAADQASAAPAGDRRPGHHFLAALHLGPSGRPASLSSRSRAPTPEVLRQRSLQAEAAFEKIRQVRFELTEEDIRLLEQALQAQEEYLSARQSVGTEDPRLVSLRRRRLPPLAWRAAASGVRRPRGRGARFGQERRGRRPIG